MHNIFLPILFFSFFFAILIFDRIHSDKTVKNEITKIKSIESKLKNTKKNVTCETITLGGKNVKFLYNKADLYFFDDAFMIAGYITFYNRRLFRSLLIMTNNTQFYKNIFTFSVIKNNEKFNLNSTNGDVYIEFGEQKIFGGYVEIRLKNLNDQEKQQINF